MPLVGCGYEVVRRSLELAVEERPARDRGEAFECSLAVCKWLPGRADVRMMFWRITEWSTAAVGVQTT